MRRLSTAVYLAKQALHYGCWAELGLSDISLHTACCFTCNSTASTRSFANQVPVMPDSKLKPNNFQSNAVLREDGLLSNIMNWHPELKEGLEEAYRLHSSAKPSPGSHNLTASAGHGNTEQLKHGQFNAQGQGNEELSAEAQAAQAAADALFDSELAARLMQVASKRQSKSATSTSTSPTASSSGSKGSWPAFHLYAPPYDIYDARRDLQQTLTRLLARAGYFKRDLLNPRSLMLLKPTQLSEVCEECGIVAPKGTSHRELADAVANLVAMARQTDHRKPASFVHGSLDNAAPVASCPFSDQRPSAGDQDSRHTISDGHRAAHSHSEAAQWEEGLEGEVQEENTSSEEVDPTPMHLPPMQSHPDLDVVAGRPGMTASRVRRELLMQELRYRQQVLQLIASPRKVSGWLGAARAQDTVIVYPADGGHTVLVVATAVSQRHAAACVEAIRWQVSEAIKSMQATAAPGSREAQALTGLQAPTAVGLGIGSDWVALDAGHVEVHVLTAPARAYYQLEIAHGQSNSSYGAKQQMQLPPGQPRTQHIRPVPSEPDTWTLDTIQAGPEDQLASEFEGDQPSSSRSGTAQNGSAHQAAAASQLSLVNSSSSTGDAAPSRSFQPVSLWSKWSGKGSPRVRRVEQADDTAGDSSSMSTREDSHAGISARLEGVQGLRTQPAKPGAMQGAQVGGWANLTPEQEQQQGRTQASPTLPSKQEEAGNKDVNKEGNTSRRRPLFEGM